MLWFAGSQLDRVPRSPRRRNLAHAPNNASSATDSQRVLRKCALATRRTDPLGPQFAIVSGECGRQSDVRNAMRPFDARLQSREPSMPRTSPEMTATLSPASEERSQLIDQLNEDLAGELQAVAMYVQYSALLRGPFRKELRDLFQAEIPDELRHAQFLSDKIAVLGGVPTTIARPVPEAADAPMMLKNILQAETQAIADYTERAEQADQCGEIALRVELENLIVDETKHKEEVEQILAGWARPSVGEEY
jgi:bacterioferritin